MFVPLTPVRFLDRAAELYANKAGIIDGGQTFTYSAFGERARRLASALECVGIQAGDRIAFLSFNNHKLLEAYFGVPQSRAVLVPLNVRLTPEELVQIVNHSGARMLFFEQDFGPLVDKIRPACRAVEKCVSLDRKTIPADLSYDELLSLGKPECADITRFDENAPAELFYTSGSTGTPKGVLLSHRTVYLHALNVASVMHCDDATVELHTIPLFHANGWGRAHIATMHGATQVVMRRFDPAAVLRMISQYRVTDLSLVPTMAAALLTAAAASGAGLFDFSSLRLIHIGGAPSSPQLIERMENTFGTRCVAGYGLTETAPVVSTGRLKSGLHFASEAQRYQRQAMAGLPVPGVDVRVVGGELEVRSDNVMDGYYNDPEATAAARSDSWLRTGDMAVLDEQGYIQIVDRKKDIIISGGENIASIEVEKAILSHPDVYECAVVSAPDDVWGEVPAAVVVRKPGTNLDAEALSAHLASRIAKFKLPRRIEIVDEELPKTGTGKIRKLDIRERFWKGHPRRVH